MFLIIRPQAPSRDVIRVLYRTFGTASIFLAAEGFHEKGSKFVYSGTGFSKSWFIGECERENAASRGAGMIVQLPHPRLTSPKKTAFLGEAYDEFVCGGDCKDAGKCFIETYLPTAGKSIWFWETIFG